MKLELRADLGEGPFTVTTNLWAVTQWERKYKTKASEMANGIGIEDLAFLCWAACQTHGIVVPASIDEFIKKLVSLDVVSQDTERPFSEAPTDIL
jgi:hypothetical protein